MKNEVSVSLLCAPEISDDIIKYLSFNAQYIHFDIMDSDFSACKGLDVHLIEHIKDLWANAKLDVHIMARYPQKYVKYCIQNRCDIITIHAESKININTFIDDVKSAGLRVGLALKPGTDLNLILEYLDRVDVINIMTVMPGPAGQNFQKEELNKVVTLDAIRSNKNFSYRIEVDGSCNELHYYMMRRSGVNIFVVGKSGLFNLDKCINSAWYKMQKYMTEPSVIYLHADLVGNPIKEEIKRWLIESNYIVQDLYSDGIEEYPECARILSEKVLKNKNNFGILCCGTGLGMSIVANKIENIRAVTVSDCYSAKMAREHNDANVLCLGSRVVTKEIANLIVKTFLESTFLYGKHTFRVDRFEEVRDIYEDN